MVRYENRQPEEGINVSREHPLRQFARLAVVAVVLVVALVLVVQFAGGALARLIPFSAEQRVMARLDIDFGEPGAEREIETYLNELADELLPLLEVPEDMDVTVHYSDEGVFNAFATIGGNLLFYRGLLEALPNENALAMVMAHEIAHVLHRDPAAGLGGGVASALVLAALTGNAGTGAAADVLSRAGLLSSVQFTRRMEQQADRAAAAAVAARYGHLNGAAVLFEVIAEARAVASAAAGADAGPPGWLERFAATHPLDTDRIAALGERARELGVPLEGRITPLPNDYESWLHDSADD